MTGRYLSKLTDDTTDKVVSALRSGSSFGDAAAYAGISRDTLHEWMKAARATDAPGNLLAFMAQCDEAMATWKVAAVGKLTELGNQGSSRSLEFLLERRFPSEFGRRSTVEHGNANGEPFRVQATPLFDPEMLSDEELESVVALLAKARPPHLPIIDAV